jgi:predicted nucleic acid-binding Zn ribbon protein
MQTKPNTIGDSIDKILKEFGLQPRLKQLEVLNVWADVVGEKIASVAKAEKIDHGRLIVKVEKPVWRNELQYLKVEIIAKLNKIMNEDIVKEIIFR